MKKEEASYAERTRVSVLACSPMAPSLYERFTYERQSTTTFKMTYESNADGEEWRAGDYLVFTKKAG